ncbi:glycosyltransferase involved in cell wall biosynthesis [Tahibacter aquaticus]|uniref:Glycosyltransferase involved in cell wall biosynthesis n=1 Tax=Tahibacter aquaticus TaxID=520092 RepID=A0A4V3DLB0_9GAMM|nr:glycosyltransferase family 4 protein [Tahibacter aquaticus]TDR38612.1 glycosyltransferase involved in cell wall biosynthesis [Tahibacter aquaticus]
MKVVLFANTDWYLYNFRLGLALELQRRGVDVLLISPDGPYGSRLHALGLRWIVAPLRRRSLDPLSELRTIVWLWRLLRREQPNLIHGFTIKCAVYASIAARLAGVRARIGAVTGMGYVFTSTDLRARLLRPLVREVMRAALSGPHVRVVLQNGDDVVLFTRSHLVDARLIRLIPGSGVNLSRFSQCSNAAAPGPLRVLLAARLLWDKGIGEYVEAARRLKAAGRSIRFQLAGMLDEGNPASVPRPIVDAWAAEGTIEWYGHVEDMPALFANTDVVVLPSYREGCPKSLIEAAACALPLIATNVPGCHDVVHHEANGLLIPARDAQLLAEAIARLDDDRPLARRLGLAARERALAEHDERSVIARTLAVYQELLPEIFAQTVSPLAEPLNTMGSDQSL